MLNFQIRGYGINLCAGTIDNDRLQGLLNKMRDNKSSLAQVMYDDNWRKFSNIIESRSPMITNDGELIITSYNSKDYYDDGHSFFRSNIQDLAQIPEQREIKGAGVSDNDKQRFVKKITIGNVLHLLDSASLSLLDPPAP